MSVSNTKESTVTATITNNGVIKINDGSYNWIHPIYKEGNTKKYSGVIPGGTYIKEIIYNNPATIVFWSDGTKTVSKCHRDDVYSMETGLAICISKKILGSTKLHKIFDDWLPEQQSFTSNRITLRDVIKKNKR